MSFEYKIIYSLKSPDSKIMILTEEYFGFQKYLIDNQDTIDLNMVSKRDDIPESKNRGSVIFSYHERIKDPLIDFERTRNIANSKAVIIVAHPTFIDCEMAQKYINELGFKTIEVES